MHPVTPIRATDEILIAAPIDAVWPVIAMIENYPTWWPPSVGVRLVSLSKDRIGSELEITPTGGRPFRCRVAATEPPHRMTMAYTGGPVRGVGVWHLEKSDAGTKVSYRLDAVGEGWLVRLIGAVIDLGAVHSRQMKGVLSGLDRHVRTLLG